LQTSMSSSDAGAAASTPSADSPPPERIPASDESGALKWDSTRCGANITLTNDGHSALHATSEWNSVMSSGLLKDGLYEIEIGCANVDNSSFFIGVAEASYWIEYSAAEEGVDVLPRDSSSAICMHGDGRVFIKGVEKNWGLMRLASGDPLILVLDFISGVITFKQQRTVRGKQKEAVAEIAGLFSEVSLVACFGGREQQLTVERCTILTDDSLPRQKARDFLADALGGQPVAPVSFDAPNKSATYDEQVKQIASAMESSM